MGTGKVNFSCPCFFLCDIEKYKIYFGKTLMMDMVRTFFEKTEEDTSRYFEDKHIWQSLFIEKERLIAY